ncbi:Hydroxyproline-rich glycoprotein family protein [Citrus sinensis]|uniref:Hydroxyproline-rich glycoprotein family protein n=1 Tax=Citrus sinensis TaxID=2711 RepID=A0ACB8MFE7_CITSI|nr:Hydroxyproline-rich glycoprotein family protein [Citrus sinensis]
MEFPFGHHHRRDPEEDERRERPPPYFGQPPPPPQPYYQENEYAAPPPPRPVPPPYYQEPEFSLPPPPPRPYHQESHVSHVHHSTDRPEGFGSFNYQQPPPPEPTHVRHVYHASHDKPEGLGSFNYQQSPPPPPAAASGAVHVSHVSHEKTETGHHHSFLHHHSHSGSGPAPFPALSGKPTVRFFCKAEPNFSLTIRNGKVVLAPSDPSDQFQHWYKDERLSTRVKDEEGFPCFALVNKVTGQAVKHSIGATHPVQLIPYNPDVLDESVLWTESKDIGDGYRAVRMVNNIRLNVDAFHGDKKSGGVHDGTTIVLWEWNKGDNQRWRIVPYYQRCSTEVKDSEGCPRVAMVNKATNLAMKHGKGPTEPVRLEPYDPSDEKDVTLLWTQSQDFGDGYRTIKMGLMAVADTMHHLHRMESAVDIALENQLRMRPTTTSDIVQHRRLMGPTIVENTV